MTDLAQWGITVRIASSLGPKSYGRVRYPSGRIGYRNYKREIRNGMTGWDMLSEVSARLKKARDKAIDAALRESMPA